MRIRLATLFFALAIFATNGQRRKRGKVVDWVKKEVSELNNMLKNTIKSAKELVKPEIVPFEAESQEVYDEEKDEFEKSTNSFKESLGATLTEILTAEDILVLLEKLIPRANEGSDYGPIN